MRHPNCLLLGSGNKISHWFNCLLGVVASSQAVSSRVNRVPLNVNLLRRWIFVEAELLWVKIFSVLRIQFMVPQLSDALECHMQTPSLWLAILGFLNWILVFQISDFSYQLVPSRLVHLSWLLLGFLVRNLALQVWI